MKDHTSEARVNLLHPKVREIFKAFVEDAENELGITIRIVQGLRTFDEQQALYDQGRTKPGQKVTNAKPGQSYHNYGLAVDIAPLIENGTKLDWNYNYNKFKTFSDRHGLVWGGTFKSILDKPHFEKTFGINWKDMLKKFTNKDFIPETKYINL